jgi:hypothetical protein
MLSRTHSRSRQHRHGGPVHWGLAEDNTAGAAVGQTFHIAGQFDGDTITLTFVAASSLSASDFLLARGMDARGQTMHPPHRAG